MKKRLLNNLSYFTGIILFATAMAVIFYKLRQYHYHDIIARLAQIPARFLIFAVIVTILDYCILTYYDALALRYIRYPLRYGKIAMASFVGYVFSHNATFLGGSAARYRIYSAMGLSTTEVARLVIFCTITYWLGFLTAGGIAFTFGSFSIHSDLNLPFATVRPIGILFLCVVLGYVLVTILRKKPIRIFGWKLSVPSISISLGQIMIAALDWALTGSILYMLLLPAMSIGFSEFMAFFLLAQFVGLVSTVPGGLGVFETVILLLLSPFAETSAVIGALVLFRLMYYLLPLVAATILLGTHEVLSRRRFFRRFGIVFERWVWAITPHVLAFTTFVAGLILLLSGAVPPAKGRLIWLKDLLPLPAIELSHFLGSLAGAGLLILARGLQRRLDMAWYLTVFLLLTGIVLSVFRAFDYGQAVILVIMLAALIASRAEFYRRASFITHRFTPAWTILIIMSLLCSVWLGMFSYKHLTYSHDLWWRFSVHGNAPRFLRATAGAAIVMLLYAVMKLLAPARPNISAPGSDELQKAQAIAPASEKTYSWLALLGDKHFIFNDLQSAYVMYGIVGRSWIVMGDPVGPEKAWDEVVWKFRDMCDSYNGLAVFYQVEKKNLDLYLDMGMTFLKLGEEAWVELENFSLEGSSRRDIRYSHRKVQKEGCTFRIIPANAVAGVIEELKSISDAWLEEKDTKEKGFSTGFFSPDYLKRFPVAVVVRDEKIIAFANVWSGAEKKELSIDLMRYLPESPNGTMDYLFAELMLWGQEQGYRRFNLGMAPLSGLADNAMAPFRLRAGAFIFRHGEHFYHFQGLREYKEKFAPVWRAKYLAYPRGFLLPSILTDIASLISGGFKGIISK